MIKANKFLLLFSGIFLVLGVLIYNACVKYIPFFLHNTVYYCRQVIQSVTPHPLQLNLKLFTFYSLVILGLYITVRIFLTVWQILQQKRALEQKLTDNISIGPIIEKLDLQDKVRVIKDKRMGAFCFGFTNPNIYISTQLISVATQHEIEAILRHEKYHLENNDTLVMFFAVITESLFPFFPLVSDIISIYRTHREVQADKHAISGIKNGREHLRSILTKLLSQDLIPTYATVPGFVDIHTLETRINILIQKTSSTPRLSARNVLVSAVSMMVLGGLIMVPVQAVEYHGSGRDAVMACFSDTSCSNICRQDTPSGNEFLQSSRPYSPVTYTSVSY